MNKLTGPLRIGLAIALFGLALPQAQAQRMSGEEIISSLQDGGYVIVMRHGPASLEAARSGARGGGGFGGGGGGGGRGGGAPAPEPTEEALEETAKQMLTGMRHAIWSFQIPIEAVYASPSRRTREHAEELPFAEIQIINDLSLEGAGSGWLAGKLTEMPMAGSNTLIVTHSTNIQNDLSIASVDEGEALIVRPGEPPELVGRLGLREWSVLAVELAD